VEDVGGSSLKETDLGEAPAAEEDAFIIGARSTESEGSRGGSAFSLERWWCRAGLSSSSRSSSSMSSSGSNIAELTSEGSRRREGAAVVPGGGSALASRAGGGPEVDGSAAVAAAIMVSRGASVALAVSSRLRGGLGGEAATEGAVGAEADDCFVSLTGASSGSSARGMLSVMMLAWTL